VLVKAGTLRETIYVRRLIATATTSDSLDPVKTYQTVAALRAELLPVEASNRDLSGQLQPVTSYQFRARLSDVAAQDRILWGTHVLEVGHVTSDLVRREMTLTCYEVGV
jgi:head-tail adaptor